ncbi:hypothetical protein LPJ81_005947 [Coemansia sp. IMI 209127]|nr:hypothetical protein LPJ81_005947 [Coemansia sp. IMI 209127]
MLETTPLVSEAQREEGICETNATSKPLSKWDILTPTVIRILVTNTGLYLAIVMHNQLYPIIAATDIADGGLGMDPRTIGFTLMLCSAFIHSFPYPFNSHFAWVLSGLSLLAAWYITLQIPDSVNVFASGSDEQSHADPDDDE